MKKQQQEEEHDRKLSEDRERRSIERKQAQLTHQRKIQDTLDQAENELEMRRQKALNKIRRDNMQERNRAAKEKEDKQVNDQLLNSKH